MADKTNDREQLSSAQARKLESVISGIKGLPRDEQGAKNVRRFADKYLRNKLGIRGTGPHSHGLSAEQRKAITEAVRSAFNLPAPQRGGPRGPRKAAAAPAKGKGRSTRKSTAQLAKEQAARAAQS